MSIKVKKIHPKALLPKYATEGAACFDIFALVNTVEGSVLVSSSIPAIIDTGLSFEIPEGYVMLVFSRSGHGFKNDVRLANCVGVIDSDYRGELKVKLTADSYSVLEVNYGDRIAQGMLVPVGRVIFEEVSELSSTERGHGGFGSTGQ